MKRWFIVLLLLALGVVMVSAAGVDDQGNPNDPTINERANACYEGGTMEGRCETELDWIAGWYLIRWEYGLIDSVPDWVAWVLPSNEVVSMFTFPGAGCITSGYLGLYIDFKGGNYIEFDYMYNDPGCTSVNGGVAFDYAVYAPEGAGAAEEICLMNGRPGLYFGPEGDNVYYCQYDVR